VPTNWTLRPARAADAPHMAAVLADAVWGLTGDTYSAAQKQAWVNSVRSEYIQSLIALAQHDVWVAEGAGDLLAFGALHVDEVSYLYVRPSCARRGLGSRILGVLEQAARHRGAPRLYVRSSLNAQGFYQRHGFHVVRHLILVREGMPMPSVEMAKRL